MRGCPASLTHRCSVIVHTCGLETTDDGSAVAALTAALSQAGFTAVSVRPTVASLEDVFIDMLKRG